MLNSKKWNLFAHSQRVAPVIFILCLLTSTPLLQTAYAKPQVVHKKTVKHHVAKRKVSPARVHPVSVTTQAKKKPASSRRGRQALPYPVFTENESNPHRLALVNALHLSGAAPAARPRSITAAQKKLVDFVDQTVYNLNYSSYRLGGGRFDTSHGIYVLDCSRFVDSVLSRVYPAAYSSLQYATGAERPASQHYYDFFSDLTRSSDTHWNKIEKIGQLTNPVVNEA